MKPSQRPWLGFLFLISLALNSRADEAPILTPKAPATPITTSPKSAGETAHAAPDSFRPGSWSKGVHLLTGVGLNSAVYDTDSTHRTLGLGSNFKADLGWLVSDHLAFELGSAVKFNRSDDYLVWDTLFTVGVRYRFHSLIFKTDGTFVSLFAGASPAVVYLGDTNNPLRAIGASRAQINGPLAGFGGGCFFRTEKGLNWFIEWDAAYQWLRFEDAIVDKKDVPIVLQSSETEGHPKIFTLAFNVGLVLF